MKKRISQGLLAFALILAFTGQGLFADNSRYVQAIMLLGTAMLATWVFARWEGSSDQPPTEMSSEVPDSGGKDIWQRRTFFFALALMALGFCVVLEQRDQSVPLQAAAWISSVILLLAACWPYGQGWTLQHLWRILLAHRWEVLLGMSLVVFGLILRAYNLDGFPAGMHGDEGEWGMEAITLMEGRKVALFSTGWDQHPTLLTYLQAISMAIFGMGITGVRMLSALTGTAMLVVSYLMLRQMFGIGAAVAGTFLLAISPWHIQFSRLAMNDIQVALLMATTIYFLYRGFTSRHAVDYALAGLSLGLSFYFGNKAIMLPPTLALIFLYLIVTQRGYLRQHYRQIVLLVVAALLIFTPLGVYYAKHDWRHLLLGRSEDRFVLNNLDRAQTAYGTRDPVQVMGLQMERVVLSFHYYADSGAFFSFTREPLLDPITAPLYVVGLAYSLYCWKKPRYAVLVLWYAMGIMASATSIDPPQAHRMIGMIMTPFSLAGLATEKVRHNLNQAISWGKWVYSGTLMGVFLVMVAYFDLDAYFVRYVSRQPWVDITSVAKAVRDLGKDHSVFLNGAPELYAGHGTIRFVGHGVAATDLPVVSNQLPWREPATNLAIIMPRGHTQLLPALQAWYPGGKAVIQKIKNEPLMSYYTISRQEIESQQGLQVRYFAGDTCQGEPIAQRSPVSATLPLTDAPAVPYCAEWTGTLYIPNPGSIVLGLKSSRPTQLSLDGANLLQSSGGRSEKTMEGVPGPHSLMIRTTVTSPNDSLSLSWRWPGKTDEPVPFYTLNIDPVAHGLLGAYYANPTWAGEPAWRRMDTLIAFRAFQELEQYGNFSVRWQGLLDVYFPGRYNFETFSGGRVVLTIDGRQVLRNDQSRPETWRSGQVELSQGQHPITLTYSYEEGWRLIELYWTPPGGQRELVPARAFLPPSP